MSGPCPVRRLLCWLEEPGAEPPPAVLIVAAHPDDEVIGASTLLLRVPELRLLHVTDGAPRNLRDARAAGFGGWQDYAAARRAELEAALALAGVAAEGAESLDIPDQSASFRLADLAQALAARSAELRPEIVVTHPYEGGHPDHDACALAVHAACALLSRRGSQAPAIIEMASYHAGPAGLATGTFLERPGPEVVTVALDPAARSAKQRLVACFTSQRQVLAAFPIEVERFRTAPAYNFTRPPHEGRLFYENFHWGVDGARWRVLAREALAGLGLPVPA
jgi:LmbE family N-acetylglucosaminyl deacetylase